MKLPELKAIMKENNIKGCTVMNKPEIIALLVKKGIITREPEKPTAEKQVNPKYEYLQHIRRNPKRVEVKDLETGCVSVYPSIYKATRTLKCSAKTIRINNNSVWKDRYEIKVN